MVLGGVVVLHDVICCASEYPGLARFVNESIVKSNAYRELNFEAPASWDDVLPTVDRARDEYA